MARIAEQSLEEIRQRVDIAELVKEYVPSLKRSGRNLKACCPFHREKTPSFMVNPERQIFHCFGCQEGGDAFSFVMKMEGLSFSEAVEKLGKRVGVSVAPAAESLGPREREALAAREALSFARDFYRQILEKGPEAEAARKYLESRGVSAAIREEFGLGFALPDGSSLLDAAQKKGFSGELLVKAGLASMMEGRSRPRDFFRGRIVYPIRGIRGDVVGFGARAMGDAMPKYLNGPDTVAFSKSRVLYGLFEGLPEVRKARKALLLEGYMDVLAAHQFGIKLACAPLGTAVTPEHAALLKRYADELVIVFDPDNAGASAALRGAELLLEHGLAVRVATVPEELDPDEYLHKHGAKAFVECLRASKDLPDFQTDLALSRQTGPLNPQAKARISDAVLETIRKASDEVLQGEWLRRLAAKLDVREDSLHSKLKRVSSMPATPAAKYAARAAREEIGKRAEASPMPPAEEAMLAAVLRKPALAKDAAIVDEGDFTHEAARRIFAKLRDGQADGASALSALEPADAALARPLLVRELGDENVESDLKKLVEEGRLVRRYRELYPRYLAGGLNAEETDEHRKLLKRMSDLRLLNRIKPERK